MYVEIYLMLESFNIKYISVLRGFMARSNIITHNNTHISMEIIQGIQNTYRSTLSLVFPLTKLIKTENRGYEAHLGCGFGFEEKMEENLVIFGLSTLFLKISSLMCF